MNGMKQIFGKEMARVFKDRKMLFSVFILPVAIMVGIMYLVGNLASGMEDDIKSHKPVVYVQNEAPSFDAFIKAGDFNYKLQSIDTEAERKAAEDDILNGDADLIIEFPENFDTATANYKEGDEVPQIKTYYNPSEDYSNQAYNEISSGTLEAYRQTLLTERVGNLEQLAVFTVNSDNDDMVIQDDDKAGGKVLGQLLPYFITILLFAGAMGIGTDMIAGEKERGTMASLLVAPVKRSSIVLGKVFSLMAISGISAVIYVGSMVVFMPTMMKAMSGGESLDIDLSLNVQQIVMIGALLVALSFLYSTIIALVSVFAKTTKEASSYVMPAYMLVLVVGLLTMFTSGDPTMKDYCIPIYNSSLAIQGILTQSVDMTQYLITLVMTLGIGAILTVVIVKAFESEKVMAQ